MEYTEQSLEIGIAATSFGGAIYGRAQRANPALSQSDAAKQALATVAVVPGAPGAQHADTLGFLERCHFLGATGIQAHINGDLRALRKRAEGLGMWMEGMLAIQVSTLEEVERGILDAKAAGCTVARDALLSGRRYETFQSLADWHAWVQNSLAVLEAVLPLFEKHRFTLALENHKDWTADEFSALFRRYSSEYLGACVDFGNNLSLLDDPMALVEAAAPFAKSTHIKDVAVRPSAVGFEMSEVPLGTGILDLPKMLSMLRRANPGIRLSLEMISRDPLEVPCLTDEYWITFPDRYGLDLARALRFVEMHKSTTALPSFAGLTAAERKEAEEENIRACFRYRLPRI